jgi:signal transduction histidine kinase
LTIKNISKAPLDGLAIEDFTERFMRGEKSRTTEGSGLGLSIAQSLVNLQGGTLQLCCDGDLFKVEVILPLLSLE